MRRNQLFGKTMYVDILQTALVVFTSLFMIVSIIQSIKQAKEQASLNAEGLFAVVMTWDDDNDDDVDLYLRDPAGRIAFWRNREPGLMHLEHDDRGSYGDGVQDGGKTVQVKHNEERILIRGIIPGEYVVNMHMFLKKLPGDVDVTVRLVRLKGSDAEIKRVVRTLKVAGDEATAFRFTLTTDQRVVEINELPTRFTGNGAGQIGVP